MAVVCGLIWVHGSALAGEVPGALAGAGLCVFGLVLEVLGGAVSRLGSLALQSARRADALEARLADLARVIEELDDSAIGDLNLMEGGDHVERGKPPARPRCD